MPIGRKTKEKTHRKQETEEKNGGIRMSTTRVELKASTVANVTNHHVICPAKSGRDLNSGPPAQFTTFIPTLTTMALCKMSYNLLVYVAHFAV